MPPLKQAHRHLKNLGLPDSEGKLLAAFRPWAGGIQLLFVGLPGHFAFDHDPGTTFGAGDARADDPISHFTFSVNDFSQRRISMDQSLLVLLFWRSHLPLQMPQNSQPGLDILGRKLEAAYHAANSLLGLSSPLRKH